jgi:hypothetical protein
VIITIYTSGATTTRIDGSHPNTRANSGTRHAGTVTLSPACICSNRARTAQRTVTGILRHLKGQQT